MTAALTGHGSTSSLDLHGFPIAPRPIEHRPRTARQRAVLDELENIVLAEGFVHLRMTALASRLGVSGTTLYALAARKDDLILLVLDRWYQRTGGETMQQLSRDDDPVSRVETWLRGAVNGSRRVSSRFLEDISAHAAARMLFEGYHRYFATVLEQLLNEAAAVGALTGLDPRITAQVVDAAMTRFQDPHVLATLGTDEARAVNTLLELVMNGLRPRHEPPVRPLPSPTPLPARTRRSS